MEQFSANGILNPLEMRRARRAIAATPVDPAVRDRLLAAAVVAPSCMNRQPWRFVAVEGAAALEALRPSLEPGNYWALAAPLVVAVVTDPAWDARLDGGRDYALFDTGMACMALMAQATAEGLVAHPIAGFKPGPAKAALGIPEAHVLITLIICGWPGGADGLNDKHRVSETAPRSRLPMERVARLDAWGTELEPG